MKPPSIEQPLVSVVMPTYNYAQFIGDAIRSVLAQTYKNLELIIIDNYSEDNTEDIIASFSDSRIRYEKFSNNGIIAASRNVGIKASKGNYIAFLDSDDLWVSEKLERQMEIFENRKGVGLVYTNMEVFGGTLQYVCFKRGNSGNVFKKIIKKNFIHCLTVMLRREVLDVVGLFDEDPQLRAAEDYELWMRIAYKYNFYCINKVLARHRVHSCNLLANNSLQNSKKSLIAFNSLISKIDIPERVKNSVFKKKYAKIALEYLRNNQSKEYLLNRDISFRYGVNLMLLLLNCLYILSGIDGTLRLLNVSARFIKRVIGRPIEFV